MPATNPTREAQDRCKLHVSKIEAFAAWAASVGYVREPVKGEFEVLRLKPTARAVLIWFKRVGADHATSAKFEARLVRRWFKERG